MNKKTIYGLLLFPLLFAAGIGTAQDTRLWATYFGGSDLDMAYSLATDANGNVYMGGVTQSTSGIAFNGFQNTKNAYLDYYLAKFDSSGTRLWATYYGGGFTEDEPTIAVDIYGNVFLTGKTDSYTGMGANGFQTSYGGGGSDAFLIKFDSAGNFLWATYYGGYGSEYRCAVNADPYGNVYLSGCTDSPNNIASNGYQNTLGGSADAFLVKFNSSGSRLWATYLGGSSYDSAEDAATDASGNVYLTGRSDSPNGIALNAFQNTMAGGSDAFLTKFDSSGSCLWSTYFGGTSFDRAGSIVTDSEGNSYISGMTNSTSNIAFNGFQSVHAGSNDFFLARFSPSGNRIWATYFGGQYAENEFGSLAAGAGGLLYLGGYTTSYSNIAYAGFQNSHTGGQPDSFVATFDTSGNRICATYYGGVGLEYQGKLAAGTGNTFFLAGSTESLTNIASGGFQNTYGGGSFDAFLVKMRACGINGIETYDRTITLTVAPNPSAGLFTLSASETMDEVVVYDLLGKIIFRQNGTGIRTIDLSGRPKGIYFLQARAGTTTASVKICIE